MALRVECQVAGIDKPSVLACGGMELCSVLGIPRVAGKYKEIPAVGVCGVVGVLAAAVGWDEFNNMSIEVFRWGVGGVELVCRHLLVLGHNG
jgi:hypothetical protein